MSVYDSLKNSQEMRTYVVLCGTVAKLRQENVHQFTTPPALLAKSVVGVVVGLHPAQAAFKIVWCRPWVTGRDGHLRGLLNRIRRWDLQSGVDGHERHDGWGNPTASQ